MSVSNLPLFCYHVDMMTPTERRMFIGEREKVENTKQESVWDKVPKLLELWSHKDWLRVFIEENWLWDGGRLWPGGFYGRPSKAPSFFLVDMADSPDPDKWSVTHVFTRDVDAADSLELAHIQFIQDPNKKNTPERIRMASSLGKAVLIYVAVKHFKLDFSELGLEQPKSGSLEEPLEILEGTAYVL